MLMFQALEAGPSCAARLHEPRGLMDEYSPVAAHVPAKLPAPGALPLIPQRRKLDGQART